MKPGNNVAAHLEYLSPALGGSEWNVVFAECMLF